ENFVYDEVLGVNVPRSEFEKSAKFNNDQTSPEAGVYGNESDHDKTVRFPSRPKLEEPNFDKNMHLIPSIPSDGIKKSTILNQNHHGFMRNNKS
ncbi:hypothetical protein FQZ93_25750, partial [Escherichia coli]|nr:hypothetical protein [Escherichia coli]